MDPAPTPRPSRRLSRLIARTLVAGLGLVVLFLGLEIALRVVGSVYDSRHHRAAGAVSGAATVVLALGDSMTYGVGANPGGDYPAQLQRRLNGGSEDGSFSVVNGGVGGANSSILRERLPRVLDEVRPDLVVLMVGTANHTNYLGYRRVGLGSALADRVGVALQASRVVRFLRISANTLRARRRAEVEPIYDGTSADVSAFLRWQARRPGGPPAWLSDPTLVEGARALEYGRFPEAAALFRARAESDPQAAWAFWGLGTAQTALREFPESRAAFERCVQLAPEEPACLYGIGVIQLYLWVEGGDGPTMWFEQAIEKAPDFSGAWWGRAMALRPRPTAAKGVPRPPPVDTTEYFLACIEADPEDARCYPNLMGGMMMPREETRARVEAAIEKASRSSAAARGSLRMLRDDMDHRLVSAWVEADLDAMVALIESHGVPILMQGYPSFDSVNEVLARVAARHAVPYVDHEAVFRRVAVGPERDEYFAQDGGHCSDLGYALMVDNLMAALRAQPDLLGPVGAAALPALPGSGGATQPPR